MDAPTGAMGCGAPREGEVAPQRRAAGPLLAALLITGCASGTAPAIPASLLPSVAPSAAAATTVPASIDYRTPDEAVRAYLDGVARGDATAILGASAVDRIAASFDFVASADRLKVMLLNVSMAPATDPLYVEVNRAIETSAIMTGVRNLAYSLLSTEPLDGSPIVADRAKAEAFTAQVDATRLSGLTVREIRFPQASLEHDPTFQANAAARAKVYGADELTERVALVALGERTFMVGFVMLRYGTGWYVAEPSSPIAGTNPPGAAKPMSQADFDAEVSG